MFLYISGVQRRLRCAGRLERTVARAAMTDRLLADRGEIECMVGALFRYADSGTYVSLRAFDQFQKGLAAVFIRPVYINGSLEPLIEAAAKAAEDAANFDKPVVFAPPICTFTNPDRARTEDLANGLALSVEIDEGDTDAIVRLLQSILGPATVVVRSGSEWIDPQTGAVYFKIHMHWRLSEPTRDREDHAKLRHTRELATALAGADPTGKPVVHPLRWPGSWNQKIAPGRLCTIAALNESAEIHLDLALERLQEAVETVGLAHDGADTERQSSAPQAPLPLLTSAMAAIPNPGTEVHYDRWIMFGYACYRAAGSDAGYTLWDTWSRKSDKYNGAEQEAAWKRIGSAIRGSTASRTIGAGTIFFYAKMAGWQRPEPEPPSTPDGPGLWRDRGAWRRGSSRSTALGGRPFRSTGEQRGHHSPRL
jgi:hypothetical protein